MKFVADEGLKHKPYNWMGEPEYDCHVEDFYKIKFPDRHIRRFVSERGETFFVDSTIRVDPYSKRRGVTLAKILLT
jgi:hypothetical protein